MMAFSIRPKRLEDRSTSRPFRVSAFQPDRLSLHGLAFLLLLFAALAMALTAAGCAGGGSSSAKNHHVVDDDNDTAPDDDTSSGDDDLSPDDDDDASPDDDDDASPDDDTAPACDWNSFDPLIVAGKAKLSADDPNGAADQFTQALSVCPGQADGEIGMVIADVQWYWMWIQRWIQYLSSYNPHPKGGDKSVATTIQEELREVFLPVNAEVFQYVSDLETHHADVEFYVEPLPMYVDGTHVVLEMGGVWDIEAVEVVEAFVRMMEGAERFLLSYDLSFDFSIFAMNQPPPGASTTQLINFYCGLLLQIFADPNYPNFLTFLPDGKSELSQCASQFGTAAVGVNSAFEAIRTVTGPQEGLVFGYVDENGNGKWDPGEPYHVPYFGDMTGGSEIGLEDLLTIAHDLGLAFLSGGPDDPTPLVPHWFPLHDLDPLDPAIRMLFPNWTNFPNLYLPVGIFFYNPPADGLRSIAETAAQFLYDNTDDDSAEGAR
jgi:hypothetical protein